jgi:hypothetical protein
MFKYLLVIILNMPFVLLGFIRAVESYKHGRISRSRLVTWTVFWLIVAAGLFLALPGYEYLQAHNLTDSTPLSIFDVIAITGVNFALTLVFRLYSKNDRLEQRLNQLNRECSMLLAEDSRK